MIAIHKSPGFADRWIAYCEKNNVSYKVVNAYDNNIISQIKDCDVFMWHFYQKNYKDQLFAKQLLFSLQTSGIKVFPDYNTVWHFDDKVGQKYLLESVGAPLVPSYVFYTKREALNWIDITCFPKVFKLRGGAGSENVMLVRSRKKARQLTRIAFSRGFKQYRPLSNLKDRWQKYRSGKAKINDVFKGIVRFFYPPQFSKMYPPEKGYVYFQDFIPNNSYDVRVIVVGNKAFAFKRMVRKNDFRASGSGNFIFDKTQINEKCVRIGFELNKKLNSQSIAYDFVFDEEGNPLIVEISFGFIAHIYDRCEGYWTADMHWHEGDHFDFCGWMVENLLKH